MTAPGPGSGKMATCLSQLYHENKNGEMDIEGVQNRHLIKFQYHCTSRFFLEKLWDVFCRLEKIVQTNDKCRNDRENYQKSIDNYKEIVKNHKK